MYNVRVKTFYDTEQIQIFSKAQHSKGEICRKKCDPHTGEILPLERGERVYNPFTEKVERMTEYRPQSIEEYARKSYTRTVKTIYDIARADCWDWFLTFTFSKVKVDRYDYDWCSQKMSDWLKNMRRKCPYMKYIVVPEQHKDGAWHFHGLLKDCENLNFRFSGQRDKRGRRIYNVGQYRFGWTTATRITDTRRSSSYLCKYITKDLCKQTKGKKRYWSSKNTLRPIVEEYFLNADYNDIFIDALKESSNDAHVKRIKTMWTSVSYIDQSIPQTHESL